MGVISTRSGQDQEWQQESLPNNGLSRPISVARSDWYQHVLGPVRHSEFIYLEIAVPHGKVAAPWRQAIAHLAGAEAAYNSGDNDTVFVRLRGALDSFPGAKKEIFNAVTDPQKRARVDAVVKACGEFLHLGRHVGDAGTPNAGQFPVTHLDASYAIA